MIQLIEVNPRRIFRSLVVHQNNIKINKENCIYMRSILY